MENMCAQNLYFQYPNLLFLLVILFGVFLFFLWKRKNRALVFSGFEELKKVYKHDSLLSTMYLVSIIISSIFFVLLIARPMTCHTEVTVEKNGIDIEILFDVSYSMTADDLKPNRLEVAKKVFSDFIASLESDRVGLVVFAGKPFISSPLTFDYGFLQQFLSEIGPDTIQQNNYSLQGTAIGDAMIMGESAFSSLDKNRQKVMILMTDGSANRGVHPLTALKFIQEKGIKVYTIGVGGKESTYVYATDIVGNVQKIQVDGVDETSLKKIAETTGGKYYLADSNDTLEKILKEIGSLEKTKIEEKKQTIEKDWYLPLLLALFCCMLINMYFTLRSTRF